MNPLGPQPDFEDARENIAGFLGVPNDASLDESTVKKAYISIRNGVALLRHGLSWTILGHGFRLTKENGLTLNMPSQDARFLEWMS